MSFVNTSIDRVMRKLVTRRMRPQIAYHPGDTAIIIVTPTRHGRPEELRNGVRLMRWAATAGIDILITSRNHPSDTDQNPSKATRSVCGVDDRPVTGPPDDLGGNEVVVGPFPGLSAFTNPTLLITLAERGIDHVMIAGGRTEVEIDSTARDAVESGLHTTVIKDCCTGVSPSGHQATVDVTLPRLVHAVLSIDQLPSLTR